MCVKCHHSSYSITYTTLTVTIVGCGSSLSQVSSPLADQTFDYSSTSTMEYPGNVNHFFQSSNSNCPVTSCTLYASDCSSSAASNVWLGGSTPWTININKNVIAGYSNTYCYSCTNGAQTITYSPWAVTVNGCTNKLLALSSPLASQTYLFSASTTTATPGDWSSFFQNSNPSLCPLVRCKLKISDCSSDSTNTDVTMSSSSPFTITAKRNVAAGYSVTLCVRCNNGVDYINVTPWTVTQEGCDSLSLISSPQSDQTFFYCMENKVIIQNHRIEF